VPQAIDALHDATLDLLAADDPGAIAGKALAAAGRVIFLETASIWVHSGDNLVCRGALGENRERLGGRSLPAERIGLPLDDEADIVVAAADIVAGERTVAVLRASRSRATHGDFSPAERDALHRLTASAGAAMVSANRLAASRREADEAARELALITEMSREITSTLDLDRVLRTVVNLAAKAFKFDRGAVALYEHGVCDIRAVAGADGVNAKDSTLQDLAVRAAWAAGLGESFYLSERTDPGSDAERTFVQIFGEDLERDGAMSGLYLPLKDEEGIVGAELQLARDRGEHLVDDRLGDRDGIGERVVERSQRPNGVADRRHQRQRGDSGHADEDHTPARGHLRAYDRAVIALQEGARPRFGYAGSVNRGGRFCMLALTAST